MKNTIRSPQVDTDNMLTVDFGNEIIETANYFPKIFPWLNKLRIYDCNLTCDSDLSSDCKWQWLSFSLLNL